MTRQPPAPSNAAHPVTRAPSVSAQAAPDEAKTKEEVPTFSRIPDTPPMRPTILRQKLLCPVNVVAAIALLAHVKDLERQIN